MSRRPDRINRHPERARSERSALDAVLDAGHHFGSLSTVLDGRPFVVPMLYGRDEDRIVMHGSTGAGALRMVAEGAPAALCVSMLDGWVYGHTLFDSSANYRSAVVHGELLTITGTEAAAALTTLAEQLMPGRAVEVPGHTRKQLAATQCLVMPITDDNWTVKVRDAPPGAPEPDEPVDPALWTGVLPIEWGYGDPVSAPRAAGLPVAPSVLAYRAGEAG